MRIKKAFLVQQIHRDAESQGSRADATRRSKDGYNLPHRILRRIVLMLLVTNAPDNIRVPDTSADFHTYAVDWQKDEIRWYFDGFEIARAPAPADMHKLVYIRAGLPIGGHWVGRSDQSTHFPTVFTIDWIRGARRSTRP
jgi:glycosyl hydrolase family 16